jgi:proton glutamate symport protein
MEGYVMVKKHHSGLWKVILAMALGIALGSLSEQGNHYFGVEIYPYLYPVYSLFGQLFINALLLLVVPLVSSSIMLGIAKIGSEESFGRLGGKTIAFYALTNLLAILIGVFFVNLFQPGTGMTHDLIANTQVATLAESSAQQNVSFSNMLLKIIPSNIFYTLSQGQMLGIVFFSLVFGFCVSQIEKKNSALLIQFFEGIFQALLNFTHLIMKFLPYGVFFLVAKVFAESGLDVLKSLGVFTLTVIIALLCFSLIVLPLLLRVIAKVHPWRHFKAMAPALITAFSTSSSSATLPVTMDCLEKRAGVSNKICSLVVPLATSLNLAGSALYVSVASIFVAQAYGVDLNIMTQAMVVLLAFVSAAGITGIPSASLVVIIIILHSLNIPADGIGIFIAVDRILDMCRATVSVFCGSCCAVLVASTEGEKILMNK